MPEKHILLQEDADAVRQELLNLDREIRQLGEEQGVARSQSTEAFGHDDASQEAVTQARTVKLSRVATLRGILRGALIAPRPAPSCKVGVGHVVALSDGRKIKVTGTFSMANFGIPTVSMSAPLGRVLIGSSVGDEISIGPKRVVIQSAS
ncbi:MAG: hypothetical protein RLZZ283_83 [Candidatus Parcubacteria bacterium]|jgi:transcription elongation GreA/GreB family factor